MNDRNEIDPITKREEIIKYLLVYNPLVYTKMDEEFNYLDGDGIAICAKNVSGEEIIIELEDEFSLFFGGWHAHYCADESDYSYFIRDLESILNGKKYAINVKCNNEWLCSMLSNDEFINKDRIKESIADYIGKIEEFRIKMKKNGIDVNCTFWNIGTNQEIHFEGNEI